MGLTRRAVARAGLAPSWLREVPLAHRGLHDDEIPANSLAAFAAAREAAVGIELDVRMSGDGTPVVVHDPTVVVDGRDVAVADLGDEQLAAVRLDGTEQGVPTLAAALTAAGPAPVMVEVKNDGHSAGRLEAAVAAAVGDHAADGGGPRCVASFNPWTLRWMRRHRPAIDRVLTGSPSQVDAMPHGLRWTVRSLRLLTFTRSVAVSWDLAGLAQPAVVAYREAGGTVVAWTVTTPEQLAGARAGADNVIFEQIPVAAVRGETAA